MAECEIQRELTEFETYLEFAILLVTTPYIYNPLFLMDAGITSLFSHYRKRTSVIPDAREIILNSGYL